MVAILQQLAGYIHVGNVDLILNEIYPWPTSPEKARIPFDGDGVVVGDVLAVRHAARNTIQCLGRTCIGKSNLN